MTNEDARRAATQSKKDSVDAAARIADAFTSWLIAVGIAIKDGGGPAKTDARTAAVEVVDAIVAGLTQ